MLRIALALATIRRLRIDLFRVIARAFAAVLRLFLACTLEEIIVILHSLVLLIRGGLELFAY